MIYPRSSRGNILFLILLAVVLFAALSYAVTSSLRGGGKDASDETIQTGAASALSYLNLVKNEVQRLMLVNGCTLDNLDWRNSKYLKYNGTIPNASAPNVAKSGCAVFDTQGGPVTTQEFSKYEEPGYSAANAGANLLKSGHFSIGWVSMVGQGTTRSDIGMYTEGMSTKLCLQMIKTLGINVTVVGNDSSDTTAPNLAEPTYTTTGEVIGDTPANKNYEGLYFDDAPNNSCRIGIILVPQ